MKKLTFLVIAGIALCSAASAQSELTYDNGVWHNGTKINAEQTRALMSANDEALKLYNSGRTLFVTGQVISYPCAFLFGWDLGARLGGGKGNGALLAVGAAGTAVGLIMSLSGEKKIKNSVLLYNTKASKSVSFNFGILQTGAGFSLRF